MVDEKEKENVLTESLNSLNYTPTKVFGEEKEELKRTVVLQEKEMVVFHNRIKELESENYCLSYQINLISSEFDELKAGYSVLQNDLEIKGADYLFLQ